MHQRQRISIEYTSVSDITELSDDQRILLLKAREASWQAYAPYSKFHVGAALVLENGAIVQASNKENASFPAGICAERNALNYASDHHQGQQIIRMAIAANPQEFKLDRPVTPCGVCRQVMAETEQNQNNPFEIVLSGQEGEVYIFKAAADFLPLHFYLSQLKK